ncbi:unnamed protein product [Brassica napus]|uniref:(rape) hypothetical protein n=1 Tax=Brassica napus TaxID=3708 RepID=A0A816Y053_BRANA|nr:unnamed protein product [Brassica napus]
MMNRDDTKAKEDGSSSVVGDGMAMGSFSGDEANQRIIDKSVAPGTDQSPRDANESLENASRKGEEEESSKKNEGEESREVDEGEKEKEGGDEGEKEKEGGDEGEKEKEVREEGEKEKEVGDEIEPRRNDEEAAIIPSRQHETESHADSSILVATAAEEELLETIGMDKESCWADDADDAAVDRWTKIIRKGKKQVFFEEQIRMDFESRTGQIEGPTNPIRGPSNNA